MRGRRGEGTGGEGEGEGEGKTHDMRMSQVFPVLR